MCIIFGKIIFILGINWFFINTVICLEFSEQKRLQGYVKNIGYFDIFSLLCVVLGVVFIILGLS